MAEHETGHTAFSRIPTWDGNPQTWWKHKQDVELWLEGEDLEVKYSIAARMVQRLTGTARIRANLLEVEALRPQRPVAAIPAVTEGSTIINGEVPAVQANWRRGIDYLLLDLEKMPGIPKVVRTGNQRSWFYKTLSRRPGESMANWLTRFRAGLKRCADEGVLMNDQEDLGWWLVEKSLLSKERKERLMSRVDGDYKYAEVEAEMLAIFPDIHVGEGRTAQYDSRQPRRPPPRANVTDADRSSDAGSHEQPGEESDDGSSPADPDTGEVEEALEKELSALAAIVEDNQELGEEIDTIQEAAEQVQDALITMRESNKKIQALQNTTAIKLNKYANLCF